MTTLRLLADDLTGALDSAAEFVRLCGPVEARWTDGVGEQLPPSLAVDSATRELPAAEAAARVARLAPMLRGADIAYKKRGADVAYKKIDSLLRGAWAAELAACLDLGEWRHCIFAPAFPHQARLTKGGRQLAYLDGRWRPVGADPVAELRRLGLAVQAAQVNRTPADGVSVFDAETEADLDRVVATGSLAPEPVLWCGSGGLARALARSRPVETSSRLQPPILGLFGSDHPVTAAQLAACGGLWLAVDGREASLRRVERQLSTSGAAMVGVTLPSGMTRTAAAARIGQILALVAETVGRPGTLIVAGGETLRGVCGALGAEALVVTGQVAPGLPRSRVRGGRWDGLPIVSKSGAFGPPGLWRDLLAANGLMPGEDEA